MPAKVSLSPDINSHWLRMYAFMHVNTFVSLDASWEAGTIILFTHEEMDFRQLK